MKILFICKGNVGRSQIAEALFRRRFGDTHETVSAGTQLSGPEQPIGELMPQIQEVLEVMKEEGLDVSLAIRNQLTETMLDAADKAIVIMDHEEPLPDYLTRSPKLVHWAIPDPKGQSLEFTRKVKDEIKQRIEDLEI